MSRIDYCWEVCKDSLYTITSRQIIDDVNYTHQCRQPIIAVIEHRPVVPCDKGAGLQLSLTCFLRSAASSSSSPHRWGCTPSSCRSQNISSVDTAYRSAGLTRPSCTSPRRDIWSNPNEKKQNIYSKSRNCTQTKQAFELKKTPV